MSTRASIIIEFQDRNDKDKYNKVACLYNHRDWYIENWLWDALKKAFKDARWDRDVLKCIANTGFDIQLAEGIHWDIEYLYTIKANVMWHADDNQGVTIIAKDVYTWKETFIL